MAVAHARTHTFTVEEYHRMGEAGVLPPDTAFELIRGEIVERSPIGSVHAAVVAQLNRLLVMAAGEDALVWTQNPLHLDDLSEPQPDLALLRPRADNYAERLPGPADVLLVIEVADTTLAYDREVKLPLYGAAGVAEAWLIDLNGGCVDRYTTPSEAGFRDWHRAVAPEILAPAALPAVEMAVADMVTAS